MKAALIPIIIGLLANLGQHGCTVKSKEDHNLFTFREVSYQSWFINESEHGTDVLIMLTDVDPDITFVSVTFRGITLPLSATEDKRGTKLTARLVTDGSVVDNLGYTVTHQEDNLKYIYMNREYNYPLKNIRRLPGITGVKKKR